MKEIEGEIDVHWIQRLSFDFSSRSAADTLAETKTPGWDLRRLHVGF